MSESETNAIQMGISGEAPPPPARPLLLPGSPSPCRLAFPQQGNWEAIPTTNESYGYKENDLTAFSIL